MARAWGWVLVLFTFLPFLKVHNRWVRMLDFPRIQLAACCAALLACRPRPGLLRFLLGLSLLEQLRRLWPFTPLMRTQSPGLVGEAGESVSLLISNVLMTNRESGRLLDLVRKEDPDLVLLVETDDWWIRELRPLDGTYGWRVKVPLENTYGMMLLSRHPLEDVRVDHRLHPDIPSIHAVVRLAPGRAFRLFGVHPRPPSEEHTQYRDAELYLVGKEMMESPMPTLVAGDLNDVAWSRTTRLFQKLTGTLDPRVGRGFYNSFHARIPVLRYSLDHMFHTPHFHLMEMRRLPAIGSDHFPLLLRLNLDPSDPKGSPPPPPDASDRKDITETLRAA